MLNVKTNEILSIEVMAMIFKKTRTLEQETYSFEKVHEDVRLILSTFAEGINKGKDELEKRISALEALAKITSEIFIGPVPSWITVNFISVVSIFLNDSFIASKEYLPSIKYFAISSHLLYYYLIKKLSLSQCAL